MAFRYDLVDRPSYAGLRGTTSMGGSNDPWSTWDYVGDALKGVPHGVLSAGSDIASLAGLPFGWSPEDAFGLMEAPESVAGGITSGVTNFLTGFIPGIGLAGKIGKTARFAKIGAKLETIGTGLITAAQAATKVGKVGKAVRLAASAKALSAVPEFTKVAAASAAADFLVWDGHEERFSDLIESFPELQNPITSFLEADDADSEVTGRLKNAIEGLALGSVVDGLINSVKIFRAGLRASRGNVDPSQAMLREAIAIRTTQETELMESFNLSPDEARVTNILIDRMGLDRSRIRIVSGEQAQEIHDSLTGDVLFSTERKRFDAAEYLKNDQEVGPYLSPRDMANIKSRASMLRVRSLFRRFRDTVVPAVRSMAEAGEAATGGYEMMATFLNGLGRSYSQLYSMLNARASVQSSVEAHTSVAFGMMADLIQRIDSGNLAELTAREAQDMLDSVMSRMGVSVTYRVSKASQMGSLMNQAIKKIRATVQSSPGMTPREAFETVDFMDLMPTLKGEKINAFALNQIGADYDAVVLDTWMSQLLPDSAVRGMKRKVIKGRREGIKDLKKRWLQNARNYAAYSASLRSVAQGMGLTSAVVQERTWASIMTAAVLKTEGVPADDVLRSLRVEDLAASWNILNLLNKDTIKHELSRAGISPDVLESLGGVLRDLDRQFRGTAQVGTSDPAAFARAAERLPKALGRSGQVVKDSRRGVTVLRQSVLDRAADALSAGRGAYDRTIRGFASFADESTAVIAGLSGAKFDTAVHELAHVARRQLFDRRVLPGLRSGIRDADIDSVAKWAGASRDVDGSWIWSVEAEERFADGLLTYLSKGEVPTEPFLRRMYRKVADWLTGLWLDLRGAEDIEISPEVRQAFDALMDRGPGFEAPGAVFGRTRAPVLLAQAASTGASGTPASPLGRPAGRPGSLVDPYAPINLRRFSSVGAVSEYVDEELDVLLEGTASSAPVSVDQALRDGQKHAKEIEAFIGENSASEFLEAARRSGGAHEIRQASVKLQALRQTAASVMSRVHELARKGSLASGEDMYEFLRGRLVGAALLQEIKTRSREFARALGSNRAIPTPNPRLRVLPVLPPRADMVNPLEAARASAGKQATPKVPKTPKAASIETEVSGKLPELFDPEVAAKEVEGTGGPSPIKVEEGAPAPEVAPIEPASPVPTGTLEDVVAAGEGMGSREAVEAAEDAAGRAADEAERARTLFGSTESERDRIINEAIAEAGGPEVVKAEMAKVAAAGADGSVTGIAKILRGYSGRVSGMLSEYWLNQILSGPLTHLVNLSSNMITALWLPFERAIGAMARGDMETVKRAVGLYFHGASQLVDAVRLAAKAGWQDENILAKGIGTSEFDNARAISAAGVGIRSDTFAGQSLDFVGKIFNLPSRFLSVSDEFFSQLNYRSRMRSDLIFEGLKRFPTDRQAAAQWAEERFSRLLEDGRAYSEKVVMQRAGAQADLLISQKKLSSKNRDRYIERYMKDPANWDPKIGLLSEQNMKASRYATFTLPLAGSDRIPSKVAHRFQQMASEFPMLRFLFPFIRTPTNLLNFAMERTPLMNLLGPSSALNAGLFRKEITEATSIEARSDAVGRFMTSLGIMWLMYSSATSGNITGGGPKNEGERKILEASGWMPYSIKIGDTYYSYRRFDPFATILGLMADINENTANLDEVTADAILSSVAISVWRNIGNKTYLTGITNFSNAVSDPDRYASNMFNQLVGGGVPFSALQSQINQMIMEEDPSIKEARTLMDSINQRLIGRSGQVPPRRNVFGEPVKRPELLGGFYPISYSETSSDVVNQELASLGHGFSPPSPRKGAVDLLSVETDSGQQAYDRWVQLHGEVRLNGITLRSRLERLMQSGRYQRASSDVGDEYDSPRVQMIRNVISKYRAAAYRQLLKESEVLRNLDLADRSNRRAMRTGRAMTDLQSLMR